MTALDHAGDHLLFRLRGELFGIPLAAVREMITLPSICRLPQAEHYVRGVINLRGRIVPAIDLRRRLGLGSSHEDVEALCALLEDREQDHVRWITELEASVRERRPFGLTLDPHRCAFGRWFDSFKTDHLATARRIDALEHPHVRIHRLGARVREHCDGGREDEALALIEGEGAEVLTRLRAELTATRAFLRAAQREIGIVVTAAGGDAALVADAVEAVETLDAMEADPVADAAGRPRVACARAISRRPSDASLVLLLDPDVLVREVRALPAGA